ncbi:exodeoxyribonuclease VII large subunit [Pelagicoccus sp. NFK12]|uniref:Exodeoxyribonuclease 7 large subunit n=1 Tax=Pelagicoccus enzymogenes TaxID=2773457 RepID=A0A927FCW2_9BACT|nr:exodeoxyribonuclease VII large subunit [Pelagicoccus enzymogenes]MBD5782074.1 exodeoxyribonuclease VII large subunit [Pelagicoccus enzymogenes]MDQ8196828.1 exodeoxyribonuclease VII large subunit [Pelagicoccus enzymogenes]
MATRKLEDLFDDVPRVSVTKYTAAIKKTLEGRIPPAWVIGEISNLRSQSSGHLYFSLKDPGAQVPAVMFRAQASRLGFTPREGMQVLAFGEISVYEPHGRYQLVVRELQESGQGRLFQEFERLKKKLADEGLFDADRKRALPLLPLRVAIVTSPTGAALQDFMRILKRRNWGGCLHVFPAKVQGAGSAREIEAAIRYVNELGGYDLLVIARGGGSIEDLWSFNEEGVARAVFESLIPVVSAVGHEIDFTLGDFAADVRAETPSAAAEMISSAYIETMDRLEVARVGLGEALQEGVLEYRRELDRLARSLNAVSPVSALERAFLRLDELSARFGAAFRSAVYERRNELREAERRLREQDVANRISRLRERLDRAGRRLERGMAEQVTGLRSRLDLAGATLRAISPQATLKRGYAILEDEQGRPMGSVASVGKGTKLKASLSDGRLSLTVDDVERGEEA